MRRSKRKADRVVILYMTKLKCGSCSTFVPFDVFTHIFTRWLFFGQEKVLIGITISFFNKLYQMFLDSGVHLMFSGSSLSANLFPISDKYSLVTRVLEPWLGQTVVRDGCNKISNEEGTKGKMYVICSRATKISLGFGQNLLCCELPIKSRDISGLKRIATASAPHGEHILKHILHPSF